VPDENDEIILLSLSRIISHQRRACNDLSTVLVAFFHTVFTLIFAYSLRWMRESLIAKRIFDFLFFCINKSYAGDEFLLYLCFTLFFVLIWWASIGFCEYFRHC